MAVRKQELVKVEAEPLSLVVSNALEAQLANIQADGFENVTSDDVALPIIRILQSISPQCDKKNEAYDPDVSEGEFINSVTGKSFKELTVIPIGFSKSYIEWAPRSTGGGFVSKISQGSPRLSEAVSVGTKLVLPNGNELSETAEHMVLIVPDDGSLPYVALLPMASTQLKHSRRFNSEMATKTITINGQLRRTPMFAQSYRITTAVESNSKGSWYGFGKIEFLGYTPDNLLAQAKEAAEAFSLYAAKATAAYDQEKAATAQATDAVTQAIIAEMA